MDLDKIMDLEEILASLDPHKNLDIFKTVGHDGSQPRDSDKPYQEVSEFPENSPVEDEEEHPAKKFKEAEEALKMIEAAKLLKEKEKQEAEEKVKTASPKRDLKELKGLPS